VAVLADGQQCIVAQALQHRLELDRVEIGEARTQRLGRPARTVGLAADPAQHEQAHEHLGLGAAEQRDEGVEQRARRGERRELGHLIGIDARGEEVGEEGFSHRSSDLAVAEPQSRGRARSHR